MKTKLIALLVPFAFSTAAFAEGKSGSSEFMHQTEADRFEVTPSFFFGQETTKATADADPETKYKTDTFWLGLMGEYGINEMLSVGLGLAYETDTTKTSTNDGSTVANTTAKGLMDPDLFLNGKVAAGPGMFRFGTHLTFAIEKFKTKDADGNSNIATGGIALTPFVGYEWMMGPGLLGARLSYDLYKGERSQTYFGGTTGKEKGGETLGFALFYEMDMAPAIWGFSFAINSHAETKITTAGTTTNQNNGNTDMELTTYAAWEVAPDVTLLPRLSYGRTARGAAGQQQYEKSTDGFGLQVGARFAF